VALFWRYIQFEWILIRTVWALVINLRGNHSTQFSAKDDWFKRSVRGVLGDRSNAYRSVEQLFVKRWRCTFV